MDRLAFLMRRRDVDDIECVIDVATRIFEYARTQPTTETKRSKRSA